MAKNRVDFSELVEAVQKENFTKANEVLIELIPRLEEYLRVVMGADENAAGECVQQAFLDVYEYIRKGKIRESQFIFSYLLKASRHEYLRYIKRQHRFEYDEELLDETLGVEEQVDNLIDKERFAILKECLGELQPKAREFIEYFIDKPDATTEEAMEFFELSSANVRTRKSRIVSRLHHCFQRKSNL